MKKLQESIDSLQKLCDTVFATHSKIFKINVLYKKDILETLQNIHNLLSSQIFILEQSLLNEKYIKHDNDLVRL